MSDRFEDSLTRLIQRENRHRAFQSLIVTHLGEAIRNARIVMRHL